MDEYESIRNWAANLNVKWRLSVACQSVLECFGINPEAAVWPGFYPVLDRDGTVRDLIDRDGHDNYIVVQNGGIEYAVIIPTPGG